jgi:hypothetical protein
VIDESYYYYEAGVSHRQVSGILPITKTLGSRNAAVVACPSQNYNRHGSYENVNLDRNSSHVYYVPRSGHLRHVSVATWGNGK